MLLRFKIQGTDPILANGATMVMEDIMANTDIRVMDT